MVPSFRVEMSEQAYVKSIKNMKLSLKEGGVWRNESSVRAFKQQKVWKYEGG